MGNECHAELELRLGSGPRSSSTSSDSTRLPRMIDWFGNTAQYRQDREKQQQFTIFYNGKICVCDVTEIQARAIICMARKGMEERIIAEKKNTDQGNNIDLSPAASSSSQSRPPSPPTPQKNTDQGNNIDLSPAASSSSQSRPPSPPTPQVINPGLSMKRSLQSFLQKRKMRMDDVSPYGWKPT